MTEDKTEPTSPEGGEENQEKELIEKNANLEQDKANLTAEIKSVREAKQKAEAERDALKVTPPKEEDPDELEVKATEVVNKILADRSQKSADESRRLAEAEFQILHKEFHPDNDAGGIKFSSLQENLSRFNTKGLKTKDEFIGVFEDALSLMGGKPSVDTIVNNPYVASNRASGTQPQIGDENDFSDKELKLIKNHGWTKEQLLKHKAKRPDYVRSLLEHVN